MTVSAAVLEPLVAPQPKPVLSAQPLRAAFASGGTGGHLYPGMAVARAIVENHAGSQCLFLISEKPIEAKILESSEFENCVIPSCPPAWKNAGRFIAKSWDGYCRALSVFRRFRPQVLVVLGGFASFAPALAAKALGIPVVVQEQNSVAGRVNIALSVLARRVFTPFSGMDNQFFFTKVIPSGNPIRSSALAGDHAAASRLLGLEAGRFTILVLGGSQGARFLNTTIQRSLDRLEEWRETAQWVHLTGAEDAEAVKKTYAQAGWKAAVFPYYEQMGVCYGACDLVVSRAGASTISEIIANGLASVLVPYPQATRDHQKKNAQILSERGAALLLDQDQLTPSAFATALQSLRRDGNKLARMRQAAKNLYRGDAAVAISRELICLISPGKGEK